MALLKLVPGIVRGRTTPQLRQNNARNYKYEQERKLGTFFCSCVCNGKKIKDLFASTLDRIPASVRCVSSIIVVLNPKLTWLIAGARKHKTQRETKSPKMCRFLLVGAHKHLTSIAVFTVHAKTSLLYFQTIYAS